MQTTYHGGVAAPAAKVAAGTRTSFVRSVAALVGANLLLFLGYHAAFIASFAPGLSVAEVLAVLHRGVRFDLALIGQELLLLAVATLATRHLRYRVAIAVLWILTAIHALAATANLLVYGERNQHAWEVLLANIARPREVWVAVEPFFAAHPVVPLVTLAVLVLIALTARRHVRAVPGRLDLWRGWRRPLLGFCIVVILALPSLTFVHTKRPLLPGGYRPKVIRTKRAMGFTGYATNQAVVNPVYDLLHDHLPAFFARDEQLARPEALGTALAVLGLLPDDPRYPLLRTIEGRGGLGIENIVVVQVEGLGASLLEYEAAGTPLMPFLAQLGAEGLYLRNIYQSFGQTDGATYASVASLPATPGVVSGAAKFSGGAVQGHYGSLARVLGAERYRHYAFAGFRQRVAEFVGFMANQGYEAFGFEDFRARLGGRAERDANRLGVFDRPMLEETATMLAGAPNRFTAHVVTTTSHSPWLLPPDAPRVFARPALDVFRYVDESLRVFVERMRERPDFARTLFVFYGDHTSHTEGSGLRERLRIPVILWGAGLNAARARWTGRVDVRGCQMDILPTILGLLDGSHRYAGMGHDLLGERTPARGAVVGGASSYYITDRFALQYSRRKRERQLFPVDRDEIVLQDVAASHPDVLRRLTREFLALQETADHLAREARIYPP
jgi:phosphoglycerol transferase MdoB-like AlkP superfamily enzyme